MNWKEIAAWVLLVLVVGAVGYVVWEQPHHDAEAAQAWQHVDECSAAMTHRLDREKQGVTREDDALLKGAERKACGQ
jgi:hypothetical protein